MLIKENRVKMHIHTNLHFQISNNLLNQFMRDKVNQLQHARLYTNHGMVLRNKRFELLLVFEEMEETAIVLMM